VQFFVSYCRSVIAAYSKVELSEQVRDAAGIAAQTVDGDEFRRLVSLVRVCPERGDDGLEIRLVSGYHRMLGATRGMLRSILPAVAGWAEQERAHCAYFAAAALDRRIAFSRDLIAQQSAE
ncbi:MAG: hypothetical protein ACRD4K_12865, partial [Candidatus Acidiferrales bacterium]